MGRRLLIVLLIAGLAGCETTIEGDSTAGWTGGPGRPWPAAGSTSRQRPPATTAPPATSSAGARSVDSGADDTDEAARNIEADRHRAEVMTEITAYYGDYGARRWDEMLGHFWEQAVVTTTVPVSGSVTEVVAMSAVEFVANARDTFGRLPTFRVIQGHAEVQVRGSVAQVWAEHSIQAGAGEDIVSGTDVDAFTLLRVDGRWRIAALGFGGM